MCPGAHCSLGWGCADEQDTTAPSGLERVAWKPRCAAALREPRGQTHCCCFRRTSVCEWSGGRSHTQQGAESSPGLSDVPSQASSARPYCLFCKDATRMTFHIKVSIYGRTGYLWSLVKDMTERTSVNLLPSFAPVLSVPGVRLSALTAPTPQ